MSQNDDRDDTVSDPEQGVGESGDWAGEGGAVPSGPATDPEDAHAAVPEPADDPEAPGSLGGDNGGA